MDEKKINLFWNRFLLGASCVVFVIAWISFVYAPFTDAKVFMASANQSNYISKNLILGSFKAWELKSVFSRMSMYLIYKITRIFVPFNTVEFEMLSKFIYSIFLILGSFLSMKLVVVKKKVISCTVVVSSMLMAVYAGCQMQAEMTVTVLILLAFSLYLNAIKTKRHSGCKLIGAGLLIGSVFYFKSVLILLSVTVVAAICIYLLENHIEFSFKRLMIVVAGSLIALGVVAVLILMINPGEFQDMLDASKFQKTLLAGEVELGDILVKFINNHVERVKYSPVVIVGAVCLLINTLRNVCNKKYKQIFFRIAMWMMPMLFIALSNKYFPYHFMVYVFPALIEICYALAHQNYWKHIVIAITIVGTVGWYLSGLSIISEDVKTYIECNNQAYVETEKVLEEINFDKTQEVLYLDDGFGAYCLEAPSYLKYFFPLPLQRLPEDSQLECYVDALKKVHEYEGRYISVYENWFFKGDKYQELKNKIKNEYEYIGSYYGSTPQISGAVTKKYDLYERK